MIKKSLSAVKELTKAWVADKKNYTFFQFFPKKPKTINFLANDICNSKCTMCNIWQQKQGFELSPEQLTNLLQNELFSEVQHIGITGGEPTLRGDLPLLYEAACKALPKLKGMSIITNAIKKEDVTNQINQIARVLESNNKNFSLMVSLDGLGKIHDKNRGRPGNFDSALSVISHFKNNSSIPISVGCTITKTNVWHVDEFLDYLISDGIYGRFRVAEFINRLYNNNLVDRIRNFDEDELYHLACFFTRLELFYEKSNTIKRTYRSISNMLSGGRRQTGCPYQSNGVVLDSRGNIQYCAPKSESLGNTLQEDAWKLYSRNLSKRRKIIHDHCQECIHDYHFRETFQEKLKQYRNNLWEKIFSLEKLNLTIPLICKVPLPRINQTKNHFHHWMVRNRNNW